MNEIVPILPDPALLEQLERYNDFATKLLARICGVPVEVIKAHIDNVEIK